MPPGDRFIPPLLSGFDLEIANYWLLRNAGALEFLDTHKEHLSLSRNSERMLQLRPGIFTYTPSNQHLDPPKPVSRQVPPRKIRPTPYRRLLVQGIRDDFYISHLHHHPRHPLTAVVAHDKVVILDDSVDTNHAACSLKSTTANPTSVAWHPRDSILAIGCHDGTIRLYDASKNMSIGGVNVHEGRIGCLSWDENLLFTGSRDALVAAFDARQTRSSAMYFEGHKQEVCGLSTCDTMLASGGNDNVFYIHDIRTCRGMVANSVHTGAVKAIAWNPVHRNILATGGGREDGRIYTWDIKTRRVKACADTGSQVSSLQWSPNGEEILSSHGYRANSMMVWSRPHLIKIANLHGHNTGRILGTTTASNGETVISIDSTGMLGHWRIWPTEGHRIGDTVFPASWMRTVR